MARPKGTSSRIFNHTRSVVPKIPQESADWRYYRRLAELTPAGTQCFVTAHQIRSATGSTNGIDKQRKMLESLKRLQALGAIELDVIERGSKLSYVIHINDIEDIEGLSWSKKLPTQYDNDRIDLLLRKFTDLHLKVLGSRAKYTTKDRINAAKLLDLMEYERIIDCIEYFWRTPAERRKSGTFSWFQSQVTNILNEMLEDEQHEKSVATAKRQEAFREAKAKNTPELWLKYFTLKAKWILAFDSKNEDALNEAADKIIELEEEINGKA